MNVRSRIPPGLGLLLKRWGIPLPQGPREDITRAARQAGIPVWDRQAADIELAVMLARGARKDDRIR